MGSGQRAYRMAAGASIAEKESYLATLQAEQQDVDTIVESQSEKIDTLLDRLQAAQQPQLIEQPKTTDTQQVPNYLPIIVVFVIILLLGKK